MLDAVLRDKEGRSEISRRNLSIDHSYFVKVHANTRSSTFYDKGVQETMNLCPVRNCWKKNDNYCPRSARDCEHK